MLMLFGSWAEADFTPNDMDNKRERNDFIINNQLEKMGMDVRKEKTPPKQEKTEVISRGIELQVQELKGTFIHLHHSQCSSSESGDLH